MKTIQKGIRLPIDLIKRITRYQSKNYLSTFTSAVVDILKKFFREQEG